MNIPWIKPYFWGNEKKYLTDAFDSTWLSGGYYVDELEKRFADLHGYKHGLAVANGTCSIFLSLKALDIGPGDEVLIPGFAFIAATNMILEVGATPVFCDIEPDTMLLDVRDLEKKISSKTKAVIPIHTYGNVCRMNEIKGLADQHNFFVLEDVAEAIFSKYAGKYAGSFSEISSYSFQTTKTITTGEGGMILTNSDELSFKMKKLRSHGMSQKKKYWHEGVAYNFRLTNLQAAIGLAQFEFKESIVAERKTLYKKYLELFGSLQGISLQKYEPIVDPVVWAFPITLNEKNKLSRDELMSALESAGIETRPAFYTPHQLPAYKAPYLRNCENVSSMSLTIPFYIGISDEEIGYIFEKVKELL